MAVELARGLESEIKRGEVKKIVQMVMGEGEGEEMRKNAAIVKDKMRAAMKEEGGEKGSSLRALDEFVAMIGSKREGQ